jgi:endonuclease/exonuclease/phosphatase family metal-dependent hydrolase
MVSKKLLRDLIREFIRSKLPMVTSKRMALPSEDPDSRGHVMVIITPSRKSVT